MKTVGYILMVAVMLYLLHQNLAYSTEVGPQYVSTPAYATSFFNGTTGSIWAGSVVVADSSTDFGITYPSYADLGVLGVAYRTIPAGQWGDVVVAGRVEVAVEGWVSRGSYLSASGPSGKAESTTAGKGTFAIALEGGEDQLVSCAFIKAEVY